MELNKLLAPSHCCRYIVHLLIYNIDPLYILLLNTLINTYSLVWKRAEETFVGVVRKMHANCKITNCELLVGRNAKVKWSMVGRDWVPELRSCPRCACSRSSVRPIAVLCRMLFHPVVSDAVAAAPHSSGSGSEQWRGQQEAVCSSKEQQTKTTESTSRLKKCTHRVPAPFWASDKN